MDKRIAMMIALVMAVLAALLIYGYLTKMKKEAYQGLERVTVLVAAQDIAAGDKLSVDNVAFFEFPQKYIGQRAVSRDQAEMVLGAVTLNNIERAQPIFWTDIKKETLELDQGLADLIEPGMRAVTIPVSGTSGLDGMLRNLQRVDLLFTFDLNKFMPPVTKSAEQPSLDPSDIESLKRYYYQSLAGELQSQAAAGAAGKRTAVLFENLLIIAVGSDMHQGTLPQGSKDGQQSEYSSVTFMVTPEQAKILTFCNGEGKYDLILRRTGDLAPMPGDSDMVAYSTVLDLIQQRSGAKTVQQQGK